MGDLRVVDPDLAKDFDENGFVVVPDLLTVDELATFSRAVREAVERRKADDHRPLHTKSRYEQSFLQCQNLWEDFESVRPLTFHPRIGQAAAELLGADAVRLWHDQALFKEPGGRETDLHQDQPYWPIAEPRTVTAWIPFEGSATESGCMGYIPGSHRAGIEAFVDIFRADDETLRQQTEQLRVAPPVFVEVPHGHVAFHHGCTAHLAHPNTTERTRAVHTVIFLADGCTRGSDRRHPAVDRARIAVGEVIASDVTPIVWPRPAGDLPEPPPPMKVPAPYERLGILPQR